MTLSCPRECEPRCPATFQTEVELIKHYIDVHHSPTEHAYNMTCKALHKARAEVDELKAEVGFLLGANEGFGEAMVEIGLALGLRPNGAGAWCGKAAILAKVAELRAKANRWDALLEDQRRGDDCPI